MHRFLLCFIMLAWAAPAAPRWLDDQFELPDGFHIYRAAAPNLSGGSYALTVDGQGRLLVGDGNSVRRLLDDDGDGVFDRFEVIAGGLGPRGPQGLLVDGDTLYAVGGDGVQRFSGYRAGGPLRHQGRLGNPLRTGGDHDAHTLLRGHDGWLYLMAGNGSGLTNRLHINETSSPALFEREASVFRISPDGARWECVASGGRNPPNLGQNYLGDLFSFDSDMEWHVGLPWYRPVRLNHWAIGGDQGWQEVGAYPPYYIDNLPGILEVGRGSPTWGTFYEHTQWPARFRDAFLVCDYRWKRESNDQYATTGRLVAFFLRRQGAGWTATMETVVKPRSDARDPENRLIHFALVDLAVAADGSVFLSDHNQGVWRVCHPSGRPSADRAPPLVQPWGPLPRQSDQLLPLLLTLPQPGSEYARQREKAVRDALGADAERQLQRAAVDTKRPLEQRLRAIRLLAPDDLRLPAAFLAALAKDPIAELRAQAAWLFGLRGGDEAMRHLNSLLSDADPFVRRRAAEAEGRLSAPGATTALIERLNDPERLIRYVAMTALAHRPTGEWFEQAVSRNDAQTRLRALTAAWLRRDPPAESQVQRAIASLLAGTLSAKEDQLDLLRVLGIYRTFIEDNGPLRDQVQAGLVARFPDSEQAIRWEQTRLLGEYRVSRAFPALLRALESESDPVTQFHLAQAMATLPGGWSLEEEKRAVTWLLGTQRGWFAEFSGKGVQFPEFWATVLAEFGSRHRLALVSAAPQINLGGLLGGVLLDQLARNSATGLELISMYQRTAEPAARLRILRALRQVRSPQLTDFTLAEHEKLDPETPDGSMLNGALLEIWAANPESVTLPFLVYEGLFHDDPDVVRAIVVGLLREREPLRALLAGGAGAKLSPSANSTQADFATDLISRMMERPKVFTALENVLVLWSSEQRPGFKPASSLDRTPDDSTRREATIFWQQWFTRQFARKFEALPEKGIAEKSDAEIHRFLAGNEARGGNARRGAAIYEALQCQTCHGGGATPGRDGTLFGPDLAGVTRRLSRVELADALVYPSKQVADRFKASAVTLKNGTTFTGFVTEQSAASVTVADREQVRQIPRADVASVAPLSTSLMPDRLLNRLSYEQIRDLLGFLEEK